LGKTTTIKVEVEKTHNDQCNRRLNFKGGTIVNQQVKIADINIDEEIYPRKQDVWLVAFQYSQAMKAGAIFPPIALGEYKKKLYLVDGRHRINANKLLEKEEIEAVIKKYSDKKTMFIDAIKFNNIHGKALTVADKTKIFGTLRNWKLPDLTISTLLNTPIESFNVFITRLVGPEGKQETIRTSVVDELGKNITSQEAYTIATTKNQNSFVNRTAKQSLINTIEMLENNLVSLDDPVTRELCVKLLSLLQAALKSTEVVIAT
jgi:hypothetical protein